LRIIIGEDEILIAEHLADIVRSFKHEVVGIGHNKAKILQIIDKTKPDLILLDIRMERKFTGIEIGEEIAHKYGIPFIYITAHSDKEIIEKALPTKPSGYIIKPFKPMDIYTAIHIATDKFRNHKDNNFIYVKEGSKKVKVFYYNILFFKSDNNYVEVHTKTKNYVTRCSLEKISQNLIDEDFVRVHRSYLVNANYITAIDPRFLNLNFHKIPISRSYYTQAKNLFNKA